MKRRYFIPLLIFIALTGLFVAQKTFAIGVNDLIQTNGTTNVHVCTSCSTAQVGQELGNDIVGNTTGIFIKGYDQYNDDPYFRLMSNTTNSVSGWTEVLSKRILDLPENTTPQIREITFDSPYNFNPDLYYFFWLDCTASTYALVRSDAPYDGSNYPYGVPFTYTTGGQISANIDLYFEFIAGPSNEISLNTIPNSTSTQSVSFNWNFNLDSAVSYLGYYTIQENFDLYSCSSFEPATCNNLVYVNYSTQIPNSNLGIATTTMNLANGFYQIKFFQVGYDTSGDGSLDSYILITEPSNVFQINYSPFYYIPTITLPTSTLATSTAFQITCDENDPWYQYSFCKLFTYLFIPEINSFDKFSTLSQQIQNKPPIGYFTQIKNTLSGVNASGTPVFDIGNYEPFKNSIFTPLRIGLSWLLWLFFAVVIFNRLRHLEL